MNTTEIKKALYKEKPLAAWVSSDEDYANYSCLLNGELIKFKIPVSEANFEFTVPAQLLIRWLV